MSRLAVRTDVWVLGLAVHADRSGRRAQESAAVHDKIDFMFFDSILVVA